MSTNVGGRRFSATTIARDVRSGACTAASVLEQHLAEIHSADGALEAWVHVDKEGALEAAKKLDAGDRNLALAGVPIGVKDIIDVAGQPTRSGAADFALRRPSADAPVIHRLRQAGAIILGKTATTEFAYLAPAATRNPWNHAHTPGGSSSGSAAAVAAGMVPVALGSQTVGSILRPAAYCGIVGFKPSYAAINVEGVTPLAPSLDHIGLFARSVEDIELAFHVLVPAVQHRSLNHGLAAIGVLHDYGTARLSEEMCDHLHALTNGVLSTSAKFVEAKIPRLEQWLDSGSTVLAYEAAAFHAQNFAQHESEYRGETAGLISGGLAIGRAEYLRAQRDRATLRAQILERLEGFDAFVMPSAPGPAPQGLNSTGDASFCAPASFAGLPSISLPTAVNAEGLPLAIQLVGHPGGDLDLLSLARDFEVALQFSKTPASPNRRP